MIDRSSKSLQLSRDHAPQRRGVDVRSRQHDGDGLAREPIGKGGWSIFHTTGSASGWNNPALAQPIRGQGAKGWFGWWDSPKLEGMVREWLDAPNEAAQTRIAQASGVLGLEEAPSIPLGRFFIRTVYRKSITGLLQGPCPYPWNIRPV